MVFFIWLAVMLIGGIFGFYFKKEVLTVTTLILVIASIYELLKLKEMEFMIAIVFAVLSLIFCVAMWSVWYLANKKTFIQDFVNRHILRSR